MTLEVALANTLSAGAISRFISPPVKFAESTLRSIMKLLANRMRVATFGRWRSGYHTANNGCLCCFFVVFSQSCAKHQKYVAVLCFSFRYNFRYVLIVVLKFLNPVSSNSSTQDDSSVIGNFPFVDSPNLISVISTGL